MADMPFLGNCKARYDGVSIKETVVGTQVVISPITSVVVSGCAMEGLTMSKDREKEITQEIMDKLLYGKPYPNRGDKKAFNTFFRIANLTYICRMIHSVIFNIVMPKVSSRDYANDKDHLCIYKITVSGKMNFPEIIFFY